MKKTIIADPHPITRRGVKEILHDSDKFKVVGEVSDGSELLLQLKKKNPALLILELDMPGINGLQNIRNISNAYPEIKIVVFSSYPEGIYAVRSIQSGAKGYISKSAPAKLFLKAIKTIAAGGIYLNKQPGHSVKDLIDKSNEAPYSKLSIREIEVLDLLAAGNRNKDIAFLLGINEKTVSTYKSRLFKKLKIKNLAELISHSKALPYN